MDLGDGLELELKKGIQTILGVVESGPECICEGDGMKLGGEVGVEVDDGWMEALRVFTKVGWRSLAGGGYRHVISIQP